MAGSRVEWVDVAKGIAILLVVLYHSALIGMQTGLVNSAWDDLNDALAAFRMPMFFFASGLFAQSVVRRPWGRLWSSRLALLVWMFALWSVIRFAYFVVVPMEARPHETSLGRLVASPVLPSSGLWFLQALLLFFVAAKLLQPIRARFVLGGAAVLSVLFSSVLSAGNFGYTNMARYLVFFLLGMYLRDRVLARNADPRPWHAALAVAAFAVLIGSAQALGVLRVPGVMTVLAALAVVAGCLLARALADTRLAAPLARLGRNTLPVYVAHVMVVAACLTVVGRLVPDPGPFVGLVLPVLLVAVAVPTSLAIARSVRRHAVLRYLFEAPPFVTSLPATVRPPLSPAT